MSTPERISEMRSLSVIKSNDLIQKARYSSTLMEQKIIIYLISKINPDDSSFKTYRFSISEFCRVCGLDDSNTGRYFGYIRDAIKSIADKSMWLTLPNGKETLVRWIAKPTLDIAGGVIDIKLDEDLKPYLLELKSRYTMYALYNVMSMRCVYSVRLYELLKSYEPYGSYTFSLEELRSLIDADVYTKYFDLKRRVLDPAIKEINLYTDLLVGYEISNRDGRAVTGLTFSIQPRKDQQPSFQLLLADSIDPIVPSPLLALAAADAQY